MVLFPEFGVMGLLYGKGDNEIVGTVNAYSRLRPFLAFFLLRKVLGRKIPLLASFKLSYQCNLTCLACPFHRRKDKEQTIMNRSLALKSLDDLYHRGVPIVVFEGGEPLLWRDGAFGFRNLVDHARTMFPRIAVTTNGTLPLNVPADMVWVSLDGLKETHDRLRSGSFDQVWSNLIATEHKKLFIHFTVNRLNYGDLEPLLEILPTVRCFQGLTVQFFYPYNQGEEPLSLSREKRREVIEDILRMKRKGLPILNSAERLSAMVNNDWFCRDDILINVDPDGSITQGCYVKSRGRIECADCGFTPVSEASGALELRPGSLWAGWRIFVS